MEEQAYKHLEKSEWTEARRAFEVELVAHPKNLDARYNLALLLQQAGHHDEELRLYQKNMELGWHLPTVVNLAAVYRQQSNNRAAEAVLEKALKRFKYEATIHYLLAEIDEEKGDFKQAEKHYKKALLADPLNGFSHIRYARFLAKRNRLKLALKHAKRATALLPESASCLAIQGDIQIKRKEYSDGLKSYQKSLGIKPDPETRQRLIDVLKLTGETERANRMQRALDAWLKNRSAS